MNQNQIVNVTISRNTQTIRMASFNIPLMLGTVSGDDVNLPSGVTLDEWIEENRVMLCTSPSAVADLGYKTTSFQYKGATTMAMQPRSILEYYVGAKKEDETWVEALDAIMDITKEWYGIMISSRDADDISAVADFTEANKKKFAAVSLDADAMTAVSTDIGSRLASKSYDRTFIIHHLNDAVDGEGCIEAGWVGQVYSYDPGAANWAYKTVTGCSPDKLTDNQMSNLLAKHYNIYTETAGVNFMTWGTVVSGEYIDIIHGIDWLEARIQNLVLQYAVSLAKIGYNDAGIQGAVQRVSQGLQEAQDIGFIEPGFTISAPREEDIAADLKAQRKLTGITFNAQVTGAINTYDIQGVVEL